MPLHGFAQNQVCCELVAMACELPAWMQMLALEGRSLFTTAGRLPDDKLVEQDDHGPASRSTEPTVKRGLDAKYPSNR